jgi:hypothetical protein
LLDEDLLEILEQMVRQELPAKEILALLVLAIQEILVVEQVVVAVVVVVAALSGLKVVLQLLVKMAAWTGIYSTQLKVQRQVLPIIEVLEVSLQVDQEMQEELEMQVDQELVEILHLEFLEIQ